MGTLRLFLAISVAMQHAGKAWGIGGGRAVEIFFIISGFYMGLVLQSGKYQDYKTFLSNRFLRIFPLYWAVVLLTILISFLTWFSSLENFFFVDPYVQNKENLGITSWLYLIFSNLFICGQEWISFIGLQDGKFYLTSSTTASHALSNFMLVPQAWSLSLELLFYFLVPYLLWQKPKNFLLLITSFFIISLFCKIVLLVTGYSYDPWVYRFFPATLYLFLLGIFTHYGYSKGFLQKLGKKELFIIVLILSFGLAIYYCWLSPYKPILISTILAQLNQKDLKLFKIFEMFLQATLPYVTMALLIGILFRLTAKNNWDRWLGELSYPLYICHILVINTLAPILGNNSYFVYISLAISLILSLILNELIQKPIDKYRASRIARASSVLMQAKPASLFATAK